MPEWAFCEVESGGKELWVSGFQYAVEFVWCGHFWILTSVGRVLRDGSSAAYILAGFDRSA